MTTGREREKRQMTTGRERERYDNKYRDRKRDRDREMKTGRER